MVQELASIKKHHKYLIKICKCFMSECKVSRGNLKVIFSLNVLMSHEVQCMCTIASRGYSPAETCARIFHAFTALLTLDVPTDSTWQISSQDERVRERLLSSRGQRLIPSFVWVCLCLRAVLKLWSLRTEEALEDIRLYVPLKSFFVLTFFAILHT